MIKVESKAGREEGKEGRKRNVLGPFSLQSLLWQVCLVLCLQEEVQAFFFFPPVMEQVISSGMSMHFILYS